MTVAQGSLILASDFNVIRTKVNRVFADNYAGSISFGNANQTYGWGGSNGSLATQGAPILASQFNSLANRTTIGANIVNNVAGSISEVNQGDPIIATELDAIDTMIDSVTTNRLNIEAADLSTTARGSASRTTTWGSAIDCVFRYTFTDFDEARYFFNSGGAINVYCTISGYSTGTGWDGAGFNQIFTNMGTITMNYTQTTQSGSGGVPSVLGFYDLTGSYQTIFYQTGTGAYSDAYCYIQAAILGVSNVVDVRVYLVPGAGRSVNGTTTAYTQTRKLNNQNVNGVTLAVTAPSYSLVNGF